MINGCVFSQFFLLDHVFLMLILTNDFLKTMNWVFEIGISIFDCEYRVAEKVFERLLKILIYRFQNDFISLKNKVYF